MKKTKTVKITKRGLAAIEAARCGAPLFVLSFAGWVPANLKLAERMDDHATWIYGVE